MVKDASRRHWSVHVRQWLDSPLGERGFLFWVFAPVLFILSFIWETEAARRRRKGYASFSSEPRPRVWCVGNVVLGGAGKSPVVRALARELLARGDSVAVVTRGSGRPGELKVAWRGVVAELAAALQARIGPSSPERLGDEAREHFELLPSFGQSLVVVETLRRADALTEICQAFLMSGLDVGRLTVILDDGFQHFSAPRDQNFLVLSPSLLLRSPLRSPPVGAFREGGHLHLRQVLAGASLRVWSRCRSGDEAAFAREMSSALTRLGVRQDERDVLVRCRLEFCEADAALAQLGAARETVPVKSGQNLAIVTGIAYGERFLREVAAALSGRPGKVVSVELLDHGALRADVWSVFAEADVVVLTGKDFFRWVNVPEFRAAMRTKELWVAVLQVEFLDASGAPTSPIQTLRR